MSLHTWNLSSGSRPSTAPTHNCYSGSVAAAYERRSLGIGSHWPFESWGRFLPEYTTPVSILDRLLHQAVPEAEPPSATARWSRLRLVGSSR